MTSIGVSHDPNQCECSPSNVIDSIVGIFYHNHLANFLCACNQLRNLYLGFHNGWQSGLTEELFARTAKKVNLVHLQELHFDHIRLAGADLAQFLTRHSKLQVLALENLDIVGTTSYASILDSLYTSQGDLTSFKSRQIAQCGRRTYFDQLGMLEIEAPYLFPRHEELDEDDALYNSFTIERGPFRYIGEVYAWEGVQQKIAMLRDDLIVSDQSWEPEPGSDLYYWAWRSDQ
jgi:hypothetical protein